MRAAARQQALVVAVLVAARPALAEPAIGQFELKNLDNEVGRIELQSQNAHSFGQPRRQFLDPGDDEVVYDDNTVVQRRHALEIEMTISRFHRMRLGIEFEDERLDEPASPELADSFAGLKLTEVAVENVFILVPVKERGIGFGAVVEYEHPLIAGELNSLVMGPIVQAVWGPWSATTNLLLVKNFGNGERSADSLERDDKLDFAYAGQLMYQASERWALALEAYGTVDRLGSSGRPSVGAAVFGDHDQHRIGPVIYGTFGLEPQRTTGRGVKGVAATDDNDGDEDGAEGAELRLGVGILFGLTENTPDSTLKWSIELEF